MAQASNHKMKRKKKAGVLVKLFVVVCLLGVAWRFFSQQGTMNGFDARINNLNDQITQQKKVAEQIENTKKLYETDEYKEQIARERLGLVFPAERVFIDISGK